MTTVIERSYEHFHFGSYRIFRDSSGTPVSVTTGPDFDGFLVYDSFGKKPLQIRFSKVRDSLLQERLNLIWKFFSKFKSSDICPKIHGFGIFESSAFCIFDLPTGEPLRHFYVRNGAIPVETAVLLILSFVRSLLQHKPRFVEQVAIHPSAIWICRSEGHPRIQLGEITEVAHEEPMKHNCRICVDLLKYVTDNPAQDEKFQNLCRALEKVVKLEGVEALLESYAAAHPAANYWMGYNDPASILERVRLSDDNDRRTYHFIEVAKKSLWPLLIGLFGVVVAFMIYLITLLKTPEAPAVSGSSVPRVVQTPPEPVKPASSAPAPRPAVSSSSSPYSSSPSAEPSPSRPFPAVVQSGGSVSRRPGETSPLLKGLLADTGDLFAEVSKRPVSEWLIFEDEEKAGPSSYQFDDDDSRKLALLQLKKASVEARKEHRYFDSVKIEVELLKIAPDSLDARIRLHDDLTIIQQNIHLLTLSELEVRILSEAASQNALAREILMKSGGGRSQGASFTAPEAGIR